MSITGLERSADSLFISSQEGFLAKTSDLGETLLLIPSFGISGYDNAYFQIRGSYYYYLAVEGAPYNHNYVMRSEDFGNSWTPLYDTSGLYYSFCMVDSTFGLMGGTFGAYGLTDGDDISWVLQDSLSSTIVQIANFNDSVVVMMSMGGFCFRTDDRGQNWNWGSANGNRCTEVQFISSDSIYSLHINGVSNPTSDFSYSWNGGNSFNNVWLGHNSQTSQYEYTSRIYDMHFDDAQHGYIIGYMYDSIPISGGYNINQGMILETNDYGQNWTPHLTGFSQEFYSLIQWNDSIFFIGGEDGLLIKWNRNIPFLGTSKTPDYDIVSELSIYPIPSESIVNVQFHVKKRTELFIEVINMYGEKVKCIPRSYYKHGTNNIQLDIRDLLAGIYLVQIRTPEGLYKFQKLVKAY